MIASERSEPPESDSRVAKDAAEATTGASFARGGSWTALGSVAPQLYTLLVSVVAARYLGPDGMGRQSYIAFATLTATMLLTGGLPTSLLRFVGEARGRGEPEALRGIVDRAWRIETGAAALGAAAFVAVGLLGAAPRSAWLLSAIVCAAGILHRIPNSVLWGAQRWREASIVLLVTGTLSTVATVLVLVAGGGIVGMFAVQAVLGVANLLWTGLLARRLLRELAPRRGPTGRLGREFIRYAGGASLGVILTLVVFRRSEFFFLERFSGDTQIALYSIAFAASTALVTVPQTIAGAISPAFATLFGAGATDRIRAGYSRALRLLLLSTLPVVAGALVLGPATLRLAYGSDYEGTGAVLLILLAPSPLIPLMGVSYSLLVGLGKIRFPLISGTIAAVVNIGLDLLLIPDHEAIGAALANSGAQVVAALIVVGYSCRLLGDVRWEPAAILRAMLASAGAGLAAWGALSALGGAAGVAAGVIVGSAVFALLAMVLRVVSPVDAQWLDELAGRRAGGLVGRVCRLSAGMPAR